MYVFDSFEHQLTRDNTFALMRSCCNEVYKVEKSKEDTWEPEIYAVATFDDLEKKFLWPKIIYITIAKSSFHCIW